jgi:hypothetical protein
MFLQVIACVVVLRYDDNQDYHNPLVSEDWFSLTLGRMDCRYHFYTAQ